MNTVSEFIKAHEEWKKSMPRFSEEQAYYWEPGDVPVGLYDWEQSEPKGPLIHLPDGHLQAFVKPDEYLHIQEAEGMNSLFSDIFMSREDALKLAAWITQIYRQ